MQNKAKLKVLIALALPLTYLFGTSVASATSVDWTSEEIVVEKHPEFSTNASDYGNRGACTNREVSLPNNWGYYQPTVSCVYQARTFAYTFYEGRLFLNLIGGSVMYPLLSLSLGSGSYLLPSPDTDDIIFSSMYMKDVPKNIESNNDALNPAYKPKPGLIDYITEDENGDVQSSAYRAVSNNGEWIVFSIASVGIFRIHTTDMSVTWIASRQERDTLLGISNDGTSVAAVNVARNPVTIYHVKNCGVESDSFRSEWLQIANTNQCLARDLSPIINDAFQSQSHFVYSVPAFNDAATELTLLVSPVGSSDTGALLRIFDKQLTSSLLDYLALGDSYSSGEGDAARSMRGDSYYTDKTDSKGGCHISTRSYPFLLAQFSNTSLDRFQSVACSGARIAKDYYGDSSNYLGQSNRIKDKSSTEQQAAREHALEDFTPGIVKQIEFVKTNKPKVVTLTGGGNDVGFASLLAYCAMPVIGGEYTNTCELAIDGTKQRGVLGDAIKSQYEEMRKLIKALKEASSNTTIYVVGYPSFISEDNTSCLNALTLNAAERRAINQSVTYLNETLKQASKAGGAHYVDIEHSLSGGRMCEGSAFVTGPVGVLGFDVLERKAEMLHPNHLGHEKIAKTIEASGFTMSTVNPVADATTTALEKPDYFGSSEYVPTFQDKLVGDGIAYAGQQLRLAISPGLFAINTAVDFTIWSEETTLETLQSNQEGGLSGEIQLPNSVKPGYHMLLAEGISPTGERVRAYQFVELVASESDRDGDGLKNEDDTCEYVSMWFDEVTGKNVCNQVANGTDTVSSSNAIVSAALSSAESVVVGDGGSDQSDNPLVDGLSSIAQLPVDKSKVLGVSDDTSSGKIVSKTSTTYLDARGWASIAAFVALIIVGAFLRWRKNS